MFIETRLKPVFHGYKLLCFVVFVTIVKNQILSGIMRRLLVILLVIIGVPIYAMAPKLNWENAVEHAIKRYGLPTEPSLIKMLGNANVTYPPKEVALLAFKQERELQLWAKNENQPWHFIHSYPFTAFSGRLGPKLKEYDLQIPEGVYRLMTLNPFSSMHLSMMINYPNNFDRLQASKDGRTNLGNNIFLHGKSFSVGCLAVGDKAIDQLFLLVYRVGLNHVQLIISPNDLRRSKPSTSTFAQPRWLPELYKNISQALNQFPISRPVLATNDKKHPRQKK